VAVTVAFAVIYCRDFSEERGHELVLGRGAVAVSHIGLDIACFIVARQYNIAHCFDLHAKPL